jgi:UDP-glucuronate decarboxylase
MLNSKSKIIYKPIPKDDPTRRRPDITKARKLLNWQPRIKLEQGLLKTIDWFKNEK